MKKKTKNKKKRLCIDCGDAIHPKRLEILPGTLKCVKCSTTNKKAGITVTRGQGDHTYNETIIMDHEDFLKLQKQDFVTEEREDAIIHPENQKEEMPEADKNAKT